MGAGHDHGHGPPCQRAGSRHRHRLAIAFGLIAAFCVVEAVAGLVTSSLALLSDAGHMLTDVVGLGMALAAIQLADRHQAGTAKGPAESRHTFGLYRLEILAAFVNALLLVGVAVYVLIEAVRRIGGEPENDPGPRLVVAVRGPAVTLTSEEGTVGE